MTGSVSNLLQIHMLLAVARLGEMDLLGWWNSRGFSEAGQYVLGGAFPRTSLLSGLELAVVAAAARHDDDLKRATAVHLFSAQFPFKRLAIHWLGEQKLAKTLDPCVDRLRTWTKETGCRELLEVAAVGPPSGELVGSGRRLGSLSGKDLKRSEQMEKVARSLAACYAHPESPFHFPYYDLTP